MKLDLKALTLVEALDVMDRVARLHDDATVEPALAALYLGCSEKTLEKMRNGTGPEHIKAPAMKGSLARNQSVSYKMGVLRDWQRKNTVSSTMEAAARQGLAFASLRDLLDDQPFFMREFDGRMTLLGHALYLGRERLMATLEDERNAVVWLPWNEAMTMIWIDGDMRKVFHQEYVALLRDAIGAAEAAQEAGDIFVSAMEFR